MARQPQPIRLTAEYGTLAQGAERRQNGAGVGPAHQ